MRLSEPFAIKFISTIFKRQNKNIISTTYNWLIDSRYREYMQLDKWLQKQIKKCKESDEFEKYYNDCMDTIPKIHKTKPDKIIVGILKYVNKTIKYQSDTLNFGYVERWEDLTETIRRKKGDCENQNALVYVIARIAGIPSFLLWNCTGVSSEGHYWLLYFSPSKAQFFSIDSTYKPNKSYLEYRNEFRLGKDYYKIWYIFNTNFVFKSK